MELTKQGKPQITWNGYTFIFTSMDDSYKNGQYNYVMVSKSGNKSSVVKLSLNKLPIKLMPVKTRNKIVKVFNKYIDNGIITKDSISKLENDMKSTNEVVCKIEFLLNEKDKWPFWDPKGTKKKDKEEKEKKTFKKQARAKAMKREDKFHKGT